MSTEDIASAGKPTVVIDLGAFAVAMRMFTRAFIKCGFAGESAPRFILPSPLHAWLDESRRGHPWDHERWAQALGPLMVDLYIKHLKCKIRDRRLIVCEPMVGPQAVREALGSVAFHLLRLVSGPAVALYATGGNAGLVVDVGYRGTHVVAVAHGMCLLHSYAAANVGSRQIMDRMKDLLVVKEGGGVVDDSVAQEVVSTFCFIPHTDFSQEVNPVTFRSAGGQVVEVSPQARVIAAEAFFPEEGDEGDSVAWAVLECLKKCPRDIRRTVTSHVVAIGGGVMIPGFRRRLGEDMRRLCERRGRYEDLLPVVGEGHLCVVNDSLCPRNISTWVGTSIMAALQDTMDLDPYIWRNKNMSASSRVPDWLAVDEGGTCGETN